MRFVTANIQDNPDMPHRKVLEDVTAVRRLGPPRPVVAWQELGEAEDHDAIQDTFGPRYAHLFQSKPTALSIPQPWVVLDTTVVRLHPGDSQVPTPARWWVEALCANRDRRRLDPVVFAGCHLVNGAFTNPGQTGEAQRRDLWAGSADTIRERLKAHRVNGTAVIAGGDWNRPDPFGLGMNWEWVIGTGLDKIGYQNGSGVEIHPEDTGALALNSDHDARWADLRLVRV